jgi:hypothetical protein
MIALVAAVALFMAGVVEWRMFSTVPRDSGFLALPPPHRLHPLRAELLWAASGSFVLAGLGVALWHWRQSGTARPAGA